MSTTATSREGKGAWLSLTLIAGFLGLLVFIFLYKWSRKSRSYVWKQVGTVKKLTIYPLKSCNGTEVTEGIVTPVGLRCK
jgi:hypothetical protein